MIQLESNEITKDMIIDDLIMNYPRIVPILVARNMHCIGCPKATTDTIEKACIIHNVKLDDLIKELNNSH